MARPRDQRGTDVPRYLWDVLDVMAEGKNIPTSRLVAQFLWEGLRKHADDDSVDDTLRERILCLPRPYDHRDGEGAARDYPRIKKGE